jgi:hypothetical protein
MIKSSGQCIIKSGGHINRFCMLPPGQMFTAIVFAPNYRDSVA